MLSPVSPWLQGVRRGGWRLERKRASVRAQAVTVVVELGAAGTIEEPIRGPRIVTSAAADAVVAVSDEELRTLEVDGAETGHASGELSCVQVADTVPVVVPPVGIAVALGASIGTGLIDARATVHVGGVDTGTGAAGLATSAVGVDDALHNLALGRIRSTGGVRAVGEPVAIVVDVVVALVTVVAFGVAGVAHAVVVVVGLVGVGGVHTVVTHVAHAVAIGVRLIRIGNAGAVVVGVEDAIAVGVELRAIARGIGQAPPIGSAGHGTVGRTADVHGRIDVDQAVVRLAEAHAPDVDQVRTGKPSRQAVLDGRIVDVAAGALLFEGAFVLILIEGAEHELGVAPLVTDRGHSIDVDERASRHLLGLTAGGELGVAEANPAGADGGGTGHVQVFGRGASALAVARVFHGAGIVVIADDTGGQVAGRGAHARLGVAHLIAIADLAIVLADDGGAFALALVTPIGVGTGVGVVAHGTVHGLGRLHAAELIVAPRGGGAGVGVGLAHDRRVLAGAIDAAVGGAGAAIAGAVGVDLAVENLAADRELGRGFGPLKIQLALLPQATGRQPTLVGERHKQSLAVVSDEETDAEAVGVGNVDRVPLFIEHELAGLGVAGVNRHVVVNAREGVDTTPHQRVGAPRPEGRVPVDVGIQHGLGLLQSSETHTDIHLPSLDGGGRVVVAAVPLDQHLELGHLDHGGEGLVEGLDTAALVGQLHLVDHAAVLGGPVLVHEEHLGAADIHHDVGVDAQLVLGGVATHRALRARVGVGVALGLPVLATGEGDEGEGGDQTAKGQGAVHIYSLCVRG